jgi:hypothetical protein
MIDVLFQDKNGVLVVSCNWRLWNFNLTLFEVNYHLKVILQFLNSDEGLTLFLRYYFER